MTAFEKSFNKVQRKKARKCIYHNWKEYQFKYYIQFPLVLMFYFWDCLKAGIKWDEQRAAKIITKTLPHILEESDGKLWYAMDWHPIHFKTYANIFDKVFCTKYAYKIQLYLRNHYQLDGYTKEITNETWNHETWITFQKREET
jgi:hypothetical protein